MEKWLIGVDEAGRGPLAGPVAVGVVRVCADFDWTLLPGVNDSKQLTPEKREALFRRAWQLRTEEVLDWSVAMSSAKLIDEKGIVYAVKTALDRALNRVENKLSSNANITTSECVVKLDGGLRAPARFVDQETIVKGDSKEKVIGLASIMAKVTRDRYMVRKAALPLFAPYDFVAHKGYGTKAHRQAIVQNGLSPLHRQTYCKNIL